MGKLAVAALVVLAIACASGPPPAGEARPARSAIRCTVEGHHVLASTRPLGSLAACGAERQAVLLPARDELSGQVKVTVVELRGERDWSEVQAALDEKQLLLALCYRRWYHGSGSDLLTVVAAIRSSGSVGSVRPERDDALGRCVADVVRAVELSPDGFRRGSSDVLASISYRPSPWTQLAAR